MTTAPRPRIDSRRLKKGRLPVISLALIDMAKFQPPSRFGRPLRDGPSVSTRISCWIGAERQGSEPIFSVARALSVAEGRRTPPHPPNPPALPLFPLPPVRYP